MKSYFTALLVSFLLSLTFAQSTDVQNNKEITHGIQFQVGSLFQLENFDGYTLSYRYQLTGNSGLRAGIFIGLGDSDGSSIQQEDSITINPPSNYLYEELKFSLQYLHRLINFENFFMIIGGGPFYFYRNGEMGKTYLWGTSVSEFSEKSKDSGFGLDLIIGVEYHLTRNVILSGEYGIAASRFNSDHEKSQITSSLNGDQGSVKREISEDRSISIRGNAVNLGLSVFF